MFNSHIVYKVKRVIKFAGSFVIYFHSPFLFWIRDLFVVGRAAFVISRIVYLYCRYSRTQTHKNQTARLDGRSNQAGKIHSSIILLDTCEMSKQPVPVCCVTYLPDMLLICE